MYHGPKCPPTEGKCKERLQIEKLEIENGDSCPMGKKSRFIVPDKDLYSSHADDVKAVQRCRHVRINQALSLELSGVQVEQAICNLKSLL